MFRIYFGIVVRLSSLLGQIYVRSFARRKNIAFGERMVINGFPVIFCSQQGTLKIGSDFVMNSGKYHNQIGRNQPCYLITHGKGIITIGNNVGMSSSAIVCFEKITIGDNVKIGGSTVIYDSDFHSLDYSERIQIPEIKSNVRTNPVFIDDNVFIGAHSIILKGVRIGKNSIIGSGSVVSCSIPDNEIWAGNPAKYIRKCNE